MTSAAWAADHSTEFQNTSGAITAARSFQLRDDPPRREQGARAAVCASNRDQHIVVVEVGDERDAFRVGRAHFLHLTPVPVSAAEQLDQKADRSVAMSRLHGRSKVDFDVTTAVRALAAQQDRLPTLISAKHRLNRHDSVVGRVNAPARTEEWRPFREPPAALHLFLLVTADIMAHPAGIEWVGFLEQTRNATDGAPRSRAA